MDVITTGAYGRCGTALIDHLHHKPKYSFTYLDRTDCEEGSYSGYETVVADIANADALHTAAGGQDAMVHLAAYPYQDGDWGDIFEPNVIGIYNALEAARANEIDSFVFASSNHVMGMYERELAPDIYKPGHGLALDRDDPVRPDSLYGTSKSFGENLGRYYVENYDYPKRFYALRVCRVNMPEYDNPYGIAERGVKEGKFGRDTEEYNLKVARMEAMWHSRQDFAHQVECCLQDESVRYGVYNGVSDNRTRWFSIEYARAEIGYNPQDSAPQQHTSKNTE